VTMAATVGGHPAEPTPDQARQTQAWQLAATVADPEIPVLTIADLGVLRAVQAHSDGSVEVTITPTYSGCPAMEVIRDELDRCLSGAGFGPVTVHLVLAPAWTTDWITAAGRAALSEYGIAPPAGPAGRVSVALLVKCPLCGSLDTTEISRFSSTSCKSLWRCEACREPFEHFKAF
jgi:ring-1,2-phenylacetyl-CoA epoxidase subunit PaaD